MFADRNKRRETTGGETAGGNTTETSASETKNTEDEGCTASVSQKINPFGLFCGLIGYLLFVHLRRREEV